MKKLLLVAIALVAAGSIAFGLSAFTGSSARSTPDAAQVRDDGLGGPGTLDMDNCIALVSISYCAPAPLDKCEVQFEVKHWDKSESCCAHDVGTLWFRVAGGLYTAMTQFAAGYDSGAGCYFHLFHSATYELPNNVTVFYDVYDSADSSNCKQSGSFLISCQ
ncbi:MAG TPA: hypothetical protein VM163_02775 [bacterium]|nr:hypothetical protein [bacterium]